MKILDIFDNNPLVKVCAPMVRYSKLEFRTLVRNYGCDLCFTPMIMADSFVMSEKARNNEFTTNDLDSPLIVQFAATNATDFANAAELVAPYSDGVDLNCGCPQRWAMKIGIGAQLLQEPETVKDMVRQVKARVGGDYAVSTKIRLLSDIKDTVSLCEQIEKAGADLLTIHGRTKDQKSEPINVESLKTICSCLSIPVIANGDVKSIEDAEELQALTGCRGVMSARGILQNPAMYSGCNRTPRECVEQWIRISLESGVLFATFHHHLVFMLERVLPKPLRREFNTMNNFPDVVNFLNDYFQFDFEYFPSSTKKEGIWCEAPSKNKFFMEKTEPELFLDDLFG